jgi:hypothetical protein
MAILENPDAYQAISIFSEDLFCFLSGYASRSWIELLRISSLLLAFIGILVTEYRLSAPSLLGTIPAMLCAGVASVLRKVAIRHYHEATLCQKEEIYWLLAAGYTIGFMWIFFFWPEMYLVTMDLRHVPALAITINVVATLLALYSGRSTIFLMAEDLSDDEAKEEEVVSPHIYDAYCSLVLVGVAGSYSVSSARRSYTSWYQCGAFALAILCIGCHSAFTTKDGLHSRRRKSPVMYELLEDLSPTSASDDEMGCMTSDLQPVRKIELPATSPQLKLRIAILAVILLLLWTPYITYNFSFLESARPNPTLDRKFEPISPLEVVISMYKEPVEDVSNLITSLKSAAEASHASVTIYIKDEKADLGNIKLRTGAHRVVKLPNIGREGETYLNHINNHWDKLAQYTIFLQADVHYSQEVYTRLKNYFNPLRTGYLNLGRSDICKCMECGDQFFWTDYVGLFPRYHRQIYNTLECDYILLSYKGQFVVSAARIRGISKSIYRDLWQAFVKENSWAHQPDFTLGRPDSMSAPDFGFTIERMWNLIFQCSDTDVAWKCPSLMSRWRLGGDVGDCQCFD